MPSLPVVPIPHDRGTAHTRRGLEYDWIDFGFDGLLWNASAPGSAREDPGPLAITWQHGPVRSVGANGWQPEDVLELVAERLRGLNADHPCRENSLAITKIEEAILWLAERTRDRNARGVEGTDQP